MSSELQIASGALQLGLNQFVIDSLPPASSGFYFHALRTDQWLQEGTLFTLLVEYAGEDGVFNKWLSTDVSGGPAVDRRGNPVDTWKTQALWPGQNDGDGNRQALPATSIRVTLDVLLALDTGGISMGIFS